MLNAFKEVNRFFLQKLEPLPQPGVYHFTHEENGGKSRLHLRLEPDGHGVLLVNANRIFHLNPTAALMAYHHLQGIDPRQAVKVVARTYQVTTSQALKDYETVSAQIASLIAPDGPCPVCDMELDILPPFSARPSAPYRMDLALTYRCNNDCAHCYNIRTRAPQELDGAAWKRIIDQLWDIGVPHIVFTGGEPTLYAHLPELIAYAERKGQITGLNTNARRLKDPAFLSKLVDAGLDHVQITVESHIPEIHNLMVQAEAWQDTIAGLQAVLATRLFVMTNTTLLQENSPHLPATLDFLAELGVPTIGLNALIYSGRGASVGTGLSESALPALLDVARKKTDARSQRLIWYTPTQYCKFDPVQMDLGVKGCTAALYNMCIEPDGSVIPCQSYYQSLGKLSEKSWAEIWNHPLALSLRERRNLPFACTTCGFLQECGGGCPLEHCIPSNS